MESFLLDLRYSARRLMHAPGFTLVVVATLALSVGATTAVFSVVHAVLLNPLGFARPDRLVYIESTDPHGNSMPVSPPDLSDFTTLTHSFASVASVDGGRSMNYTGGGGPAARVSAARVGASFFSLLGVSAERGRTFAAGEDGKNADLVVVLSDAGWHRYFGGDSSIIGQHVTLDGKSYRVIGIAPPTFTFPKNPDLWYPAVWQSFEIGDANRGDHSVDAIARLRDGATLASTNRDIGVQAARIARAFPQHDAKIGARVGSLRERIVGDVERPLWAMMGAAALVLFIACANLANLMLVRATSRQSEMAVRAALGASRRRAVQHALAESLLLAVPGAICGILLATWAVDALVAAAPTLLPRVQEITVDWQVLAFGVLATGASAMIFGLVAAAGAGRADVATVLRSSGRGGSAGGKRTRSALVVGELALATVLLVGAGLLVRSVQRLLGVDPGFRPDHLLVFDVALSGTNYQYDRQTNTFSDEVERRLSALPGTQSVAVTAERPLDRDGSFDATTSFTVEGQPKPTAGNEDLSRILPVSPTFFSTAGVSVVRGRAFTEAENRLDAAPGIVINEALAKKYFPGENPIGKHLTFGISHSFGPQPGDTVRARGEIVGIARNVRQTSLARAPEAATYFPYHTAPFGASFLVRTTADPVTVERAIRQQLAAIDRDVPLYGLQTMHEALSDSVAQPRFYMALLAAFAAIALFLSGLGTYGVVAYTVGQQTREFGIRIALGATSAEVRRVVLRGVIRLAILGIAVGAVMAAIATRVLNGILFGVGALDPLTFVAVALVLGSAAALAGWLPARRAGRVDPLVAMRAE